MKEFDFFSVGAGKIHAYRWEPEGEPVVVVQIVHGIAEHMLRYDAFARFLNAHGALVVAEDHMGHGKSQGSGASCHFSGGWCAAVDDTYALLRRTKEEFPDVPYFILGHSMGSFLTRTLLFRHRDAGLRGAILCGTGWQPKPVLRAGLALCALERLRLGETGNSKLMVSLMFGAYNRKFPDAATPNDWICSDPQVVTAYTEDPLCGMDPTLGLTRAMLQGLCMIQKQKNLEQMPKDLPVFFIAGKDDPVGNMGKGVEKTRDRFLRAGMREVSLKLYEGRHEILNEPNRQEVYDDVWQFIDAHR